MFVTEHHGSVSLIDAPCSRPLPAGSAPQALRATECSRLIVEPHQHYTHCHTSCLTPRAYGPRAPHHPLPPTCLRHHGSVAAENRLLRRALFNPHALRESPSPTRPKHHPCLSGRLIRLPHALCSSLTRSFHSLSHNRRNAGRCFPSGVLPTLSAPSLCRTRHQLQQRQQAASPSPCLSSRITCGCAKLAAQGMPDIHYVE